MASIPQVKQRLTAQEYVETYPETTQPMELINGEVIVSPTPFDLHMDIVSNIFALLVVHVNSNKLGKVKTAPSDIHMGGHVVQPDVFFISKENTRCKREADGYLHGAPDLCIEVLSDSTAKRDRHDKPSIYAANGVREYWIVEPEARFIELYTLANETFTLKGTYEEGETFTSTVLPGLAVKVSDISEAFSYASASTTMR